MQLTRASIKTSSNHVIFCVHDLRPLNLRLNKRKWSKADRASKRKDENQLISHMENDVFNSRLEEEKCHAKKFISNLNQETFTTYISTCTKIVQNWQVLNSKSKFFWDYHCIRTICLQAVICFFSISDREWHVSTQVTSGKIRQDFASLNNHLTWIVVKNWWMI